MKFIARIVIPIASAVLLVPLAFSDTVVSTSGPQDLGITLGGPLSQVSAVGWTSTKGYTGVDISADVFIPNGASITGYLTTQIGPNETPADQLASVTLTASVNGSDTFFSGLTLGPGSYYLVLNGDPSGQAAVIVTESPTTQTGPGVTFDGDFEAAPGNSTNPPASSFVPASFDPFLFQVTGNPIASPEPSSLKLILVIAIGICLFAGVKHWIAFATCSKSEIVSTSCSR